METTGEIVLRQGVKNFVPGETVTGELVWMSPGAVEIRLFWFTEGRGTQDVGVVARKEFSAGEIKGGFSFTLPAMPYSFSGQLVAVKWALELVDEDEESLVQQKIIVSPTAEEVILPEVVEPRTAPRKRWRRKK